MKNIQFCIRFFVAVGLVLCLSKAMGQGLGNSPYSSLGIGERMPVGFAENQAIGGAGVASSMGLYVNNLNPALLARNKYTVFSMGILGQAKGIKTDTESQHSFAMNLNYLNLAFPVNKNWSMGIGLQPYTYTDFKLKGLNSNISGDTTNYKVDFTAKGGSNKIAWNNGFEVGKELFFGVESSVLFGQINRSTNSQIQNDGQFYKVNFTESQILRGVIYKLGMSWRHKMKNDKYFNFGVAYEPKNKITNDRVRTTQTLANDGTILNNPDTLANSQLKAKINLPSELRIGISYEILAKSTFYADLILNKASEYKNLLGQNDGLKNTVAVSVGAEYFPSFTSTKFLKRTAYRVGLNTGTSPYSQVATGEQLKDYSLTLGLGLPLRNSSLMNVGFVAGRRGSKTNGGFVENYNKITLGFTLNDIWFAKQKID